MARLAPLWAREKAGRDGERESPGSPLALASPLRASALWHRARGSEQKMRDGMKRLGLLAAFALSFAAGLLAGAAAIHRPIPNAPLELPPARRPWDPKDVMGPHRVGWHPHAGRPPGGAAMGCRGDGSDLRARGGFGQSALRSGPQERHSGCRPALRGRRALPYRSLFGGTPPRRERRTRRLSDLHQWSGPTVGRLSALSSSRDETRRRPVMGSLRRARKRAPKEGATSVCRALGSRG